MTASGSVATTAAANVIVLAGYVKRGAITSTATATVTVTAVKKWEPQPITPETWAPISVTEENWTVLGFPEYLEAA
jgi:hypothetical protein